MVPRLRIISGKGMAQAFQELKLLEMDRLVLEIWRTLVLCNIV